MGAGSGSLSHEVRQEATAHIQHNDTDSRIVLSVVFFISLSFNVVRSLRRIQDDNSL